MAINEQTAAELLARLVAIPSVNPNFRQPGDPDDWFNEARMADFVADWLRARGLEVEIEPVHPERPNVVARLKGTGGAPSMLWEGHLDTVQVTGMTAPFEPRVEGGRLYGRGAVDDKGCVTAFMLAMAELAKAPPAGDVVFLAAADEEFRFTGIMRHLETGARYELGVAGEPTNLRIVRACKGCVRWFLEVHGRAAHTAKPHEGVDALMAATQILAGFRERMAERTQSHPLLGSPTLVCTSFESGHGPNTVPPRATLRFDYRYLPSESSDAIWREFRDLAKTIGAKIPGVSVTAHEPFIDSSAMDVPDDAPIVSRLGAVCKDFGIDPTPEGVPYGSDATKMVNNGAIPTVVFGPGSIDQAHAADEFVDLAEVVKAAEMLIALARGAGFNPPAG